MCTHSRQRRWWPGSGVHWQSPGPWTCPCQGEDPGPAGETDMCSVQVYRAHRQSHTDTGQVNMETRWHPSVTWVTSWARWQWRSERESQEGWVASHHHIMVTLCGWQAGWVHQACKPHTQAQSLQFLMWLGLIWEVQACVLHGHAPHAPWFTLGINKSQPGEPHGLLSAICTWVPPCSPRPVLCTALAAPIYHDIYGMCQTNIQQEIGSWHKLLFVCPIP